MTRIRSRTRIRSLALAGVVCVSCGGTTSVAPCPRPVAAPERARPVDTVESFGNVWIGGFGSGPDGAFLRVDFGAGLSRLQPSEDRPPLGIIHPVVENDSSGRAAIRFGIHDGKQRRTFRMVRTANDVLDGWVSDEKGVSSQAQLVRLASTERPAVDAAFGGTYLVGGGARGLLFVDGGTIFDTRDGSERRLFLREGRRARVGAGVALAHPSLGDASIDESGALRLDGSAPLVAPRFAMQHEDVGWSSGGITLKGTLLAPAAGGPHPVLVYVHGSGRLTRKDHWANMMARVLLAEGYAVFLYDKRGTGESGGEYVGAGARDTNNVSVENLDRLAGDAAAAADMLAQRSDIDPTRVGFFGISQAGWIVPLAAKKSKAAHFSILVSGPTVRTNTELAFSALVGSGEACMPIDEADRVAREHAPKGGFDPAPAIAALDIPGLWLYGARDSSIPVASSIAVLEPLKKKRAFEVTSISGAGHELYLVARDVEDERLRSPGLAPAALDAIREWLRRKVPKRN